LPDPLRSLRGAFAPQTTTPTLPKVVAVILNTDRKADTLECLASLGSSTYPNLEVVVLDNRSSDGSVDAVRRQHPWAQVVELTENRGYAGNNNVGVARALSMGAAWVFVLNEDTVLAPDCIERLVAAAGDDDSVGVVGPMVYHHDEPRVIQSAGGGLSARWEGFHHGQNQSDDGQYAEVRDVDWITGCGILVRRAVIERIGGIDERFFIYWEETEWCVRARKAGWRVVHVPTARMWHKGVQRVYRPKPSVTYYSTRNRLLLLHTHGAPMRAWITAWLQLARTLASWTIRPKWRAQAPHRHAMWRGVVDFLRRRWGAMPPSAA
jgi:hypothetical protein